MEVELKKKKSSEPIFAVRMDQDHREEVIQLLEETFLRIKSKTKAGFNPPTRGLLVYNALLVGLPQLKVKAKK